MKLFAGVDLGGTNIAVGIVDAEGNIIARANRPTGMERGYEAVLSDIADAVRDAAMTAEVPMEKIISVGVGVPGTVGTDGRTVIVTPNLKWYGIPFGDDLSELLGKPVFLGNDADCAVWAEAVCGAAQGKKSAVMLTLGTGVGGGIIIDGRLFKGGTAGGTELGHVPLKKDGLICSCGGSGCIEMYASATALIRRTKEIMKEHPESAMWKYSPSIEKVNGKTAFDAAKDGDEWAQYTVDEYISYVAVAAAGFVNVFRPEIFLFGGGICNQGDNFIKPLEEEIGKRCFGSPLIAPPPVAAAKLGNDAGIIGAALLCTAN